MLLVPQNFANPFGRSATMASFNPAAVTNVFFLAGNLYNTPCRNLEQTIVSTTMDGFSKVPPNENIVVLGHERIYEPGFLGNKYGRKWSNNSLLSKALKQAEKQHPYTTVFLGNYLNRSNGDNRMVLKRESQLAHEAEAAAFRVCASILKEPLSQLVKYYFVCACNLGEIPLPQKHTIYVNDSVFGLKRVSPEGDSGWIDPLVVGSVSVWDNEMFKHHILRLIDS